MAGLGIMTYELSTARKSAAKDLIALGGIVAANSTGALAFHDRAAGARIISELQDQPVVVAARMIAMASPAAEPFTVTRSFVPANPSANRLELFGN